MPPKVQQKSKAQKAAAAMAGGKGKKKKWNKGKTRDKIVNAVLMDQGTYDKLLKDVPKYKLITTSVLMERLRINGALARRAIDHLVEKQVIRPVCKPHHAQLIYTGTIEVDSDADE